MLEQKLAIPRVLLQKNCFRKIVCVLLCLRSLPDVPGLSKIDGLQSYFHIISFQEGCFNASPHAQSYA